MLRPKSLFLRLAITGSIGSVISVLALGSYIATEQSDAARQSTYKEAYLITNGLATSLAPYFVIKDYANIDQTINQFINFPHLDSLLVLTKNGKAIIEATQDSTNNNWKLTHFGVAPLLPTSRYSVIENNHITTWLPVTIGDSQLGWVRTRITLDHILATQAQIHYRTLLISLLSLVLSSVVLLISLRNPLRQIKRATDFAKKLPSNFGKTLNQTSSVVKFKKLVGGGSMQIVNQTVPAALRKIR